MAKRFTISNPVHQIFTLSAEDMPNQIRYIGVSTRPSQIVANITRQQAENAVGEWAAEVADRDQSITVNIVFTTQNEDEARRELISRKAELLAAGHDLLNQR